MTLGKARKCCITPLLAVAVLAVTSASASADFDWFKPPVDHSVRFISYPEPQDEKPTYDQIVEELNKTRTELGALRNELSGGALDNAARQQLLELRDAVGWELSDRELRDFNYEPRGEGDTPGPGGEMGDMATQSNNPVGGLWMLWLQNDMQLYEGPLGGKRIFNTTVFQPVMPVQLNDRWKLINRPVFLMHFFETPTPFDYNPGGSFPPVTPPNAPFDTQGGLGDIGLIQWLSNSPVSSRMVTGFGWNWMFPAATFPDLGTQRVSVGPSAVAMYLGDKVIAGAIMQQYFSLGEGPDPRVAYMDLQYVCRYRLNPMFSVGFAPNIKWDQVTGKTTVPVGFGFDAMTMAFGKLPMRWGAELQYFASHEEGTRPFDPEWNFRLYVSPIIRAPDWATRGLFGNCCKRRR
jgi:hypothetical protein